MCINKSNLTLEAVVPHVRQGCNPSYFPTVTIRGWILCFIFSVNIGTNILNVTYFANTTLGLNGNKVQWSC